MKNKVKRIVAGIALAVALSAMAHAQGSPGWYLLAPLPNTASNHVAFPFATDRPISTWSIIASFDSATDCEMVLMLKQNNACPTPSGAWSSLMQNMPGIRATWEKAVGCELGQIRADNSVCIATTDPRLAQGGVH